MTMAATIRKYASVVHAVVAAGTGMATSFGAHLTAEQVGSITAGVSLVIGALVQVDAGKNGNGK